MNLINTQKQPFQKRRLKSSVVIVLLACVFVFAPIANAFTDAQSVCMKTMAESSMMHGSNMMDMDHSEMEKESTQSCCDQADMDNCNNSCGECASSFTALNMLPVAGFNVAAITPRSSMPDHYVPFLNTPPLLRPPVIT